MILRRIGACLPALLILLPVRAPAHTIPEDVTVRMFAKPAGGRLDVLVRVPFTALADAPLPAREKGDLDLAQIEPMLPDAAKTWISDWIDVYEGDTLLPKPRIVESRVSLPSDISFASYELAAEHFTEARLPGSVEVFP